MRRKWVGISQLTLPLSISLHLSVFLSRPYEADGGPPEFGSARGFYPLRIFFYPAAVALCLLKGDQLVFPLVVQSPSRRLWMWFSIWSWWSDWLFWTFLSNDVVVTFNIWSNQVIWWHSMGGPVQYTAALGCLKGCNNQQQEQQQLDGDKWLISSRCSTACV